MSAPQSEIPARHGAALDGTCPAGSLAASTSGDDPRPDLPRTGAGVVALPAPAPLARTWLTGPDLYDWIALRRVHDGGISRMDDRWFDGGFRVPGYVTEALTALWTNGQVTLAEQDGCGMQRAALTPTGTARYHSLCALSDRTCRDQHVSSHSTGVELGDERVGQSLPAR